MVKKTIILLSMFFLLVFVNLFIAGKLYADTEKNYQIVHILEELKTLSELDEIDEDINVSEGDVKDKRVAILKEFFRRHDSPLYEHATYIVQVSDDYELDHRLIPAIAMQESTACKFIPKNSYNCWGWGIYGTTVTRFGSYEEGIETVARGLKLNYVDKGLTTTEAIMSKYTPSSNGSWARGVNTVLGVLDVNH